MKIVHLITTIDLGGAEKQLLMLARCQKQNGHEVEIIFLKDKPALLKDFVASGIKVNTTFCKENFFYQVYKLRKYRNLRQIVWHAHLPRAELLCSLALPRNSFIVTRHNAEQFLPKGSVFLSRFLSRFVLSRVFRFISISKAVSVFLMQSTEAANLDRNVVIYYGVDTTRAIKRKEMKQAPQRLTIGTISRLVPQKNLSLALHVVRELAEFSDLQLDFGVAGTGPLLLNLQSLSQSLGISDLVTWHGQIKDTSEFYQSLDIFILTSDYEGFGLVLLEAMMAGIPIVARKVSAVPEVLGNEHPGLVDSDKSSEFAARVKSFGSNTTLLSRCLEYQSLQLEAFSIQKSEYLHREIYSQLMFGRERGGH